MVSVPHSFRLCFQVMSRSIPSVLTVFAFWYGVLTYKMVPEFGMPGRLLESRPSVAAGKADGLFATAWTLPMVIWFFVLMFQ